MRLTSESDSPLKYPPLPDAWRRRGAGSFLLFFGPGAIIASVTIGSGETVFASRGGAVFGYSLLWCFLAGGIMKFVQVYTAARYITLTGEHPLERWKYLPGPRGWVVWVFAAITVLCFPLWLSGLPKMLGGLAVWVLGLEDVGFWNDPRVWGTIFVVVAVTLTMIQSYAALERTQTILVAFFLACILAAAVVIRPDWLAVLMGAVVPHLPVYEPWVHLKYPGVALRSPWIEVGTYLGAIGGGTQDYFGYIGILREKRWGLAGHPVSFGSKGVNLDVTADNLALGRSWLRAPLSDSAVSFACVVTFTLAFVVLGAAVLRPQEIVPEGLKLLTVQSQFLTLIHPWLLYVYQAGVFMAFFGTILGAYELYVRTTYECLRPVVRGVAEKPIGSLRPWVVAYCGVFGLAIMWVGGNPVSIVTPAALFGGVLTCGVWCLLMVWTDRRFLPPGLRMNRILLILNLASGIFLTGWGIRGVVEYIAG